MKFSEIIDQASDLLQRNGRITYRVLKREFDLDDAQLEDLKEGLLFTHPEIEDVDGHGLVLTSGERNPYGAVECHKRVGGILKCYYRRAA